VSESIPLSGRLGKGERAEDQPRAGGWGLRGEDRSPAISAVKSRSDRPVPPRPCLGAWSLWPGRILAFPVTSCCSGDAAQPAVLEGMLVADAPLGRTGSNLS